MAPTAPDSFDDAAGLLAPKAVSRFLAAQGWELETRRPGVREIWRLGRDTSCGPARVMLPLARDYVDFQDRFKDALASLGHVYEISAEELRKRVSSADFDSLFVRINQPTADGSLPFRQAGRTIDSLVRMMKAAATTTADPLHSHQGRRPAVVSDFMERHVRLGQTMRGSFVFTVVAGPGGTPPEGDDAPESRTAFSRRVMTTLARGLESTRRLALQWDESVLDLPAEHALSAALVESVEEMTRPDDLDTLDLSFAWAATGPPPEVGPCTIVMDRDVIAGLPRLRERLVRREEPAHRTTLIGIVKSLVRSSTEPDSAVATLLTEVRGKTRSVHVPLKGSDHAWAVAAYQAKVPIIVTGDLEFERRAWRLSGGIDMDRAFLKNVLKARLSDSPWPEDA
ncbi:hypothetical protein [Nocardiopsis sp. CNT312]|uniref:hypothetical protein n=1 Tax=Nocardiopsis sp. CNT312 TaxID=1137268 RepID=UPI0004AFA262|nr:hypothetical protein [Nocardiopsis sp. CNT312]